MRTICFVICAASLFGHVVFGQERQSVESPAEAVAVGSTVAYQTALARADVAIAKSLLNEKLLKGEVGEAIRDQTVGRYRHWSGKLHDVSPRLGPQGLDHVSVQLNENGIPHRLMVDETKFGSTKQLPTTKSGEIQMGKMYVSDRLSSFAKRLDTIRAQAQSDMTLAKVPPGISPKRLIRIPLSDSESVVFWRPATGKGSWHYDGPPESLARASTQLKNMSDLFRAGADGRIDFRKRIFQVKPTEGMGFEVTIRNAADVEKVGGRIEDLPVSARIPGSLNEPEWKEAFRKGIARELRRTNPAWTASKADFLARRLVVEARSTEDLLSKVSYEKALSDVRFSRFTILDAGKSGAAAVLIAVPLEMVFQAFSDSPADWSRVVGIGVLAGGSGAIGNLAGSATTYALVQTELGKSASGATAEILGLRSASRLANVAGGAVGGGATAILFAYGGYWLDYYDLQTANRSAVASLAGTAAATGYVLFSTPSIDAAAAEIGGVLAVEAEAGAGEGPPGWIVSGIAIAVTAPVLYGFHAWDEHQDNIRLAKTIEYLSAK